MQPVYFGPYRIVSQTGELAFEVDIPATSKRHRVINSKWFRKFYERSTSYPKQPPKTELETAERAKKKEIIAIAGYNKSKEEFDVYWTDCHPGHSSTISRELFWKQVPEIQRNSLLANLRALDPNLV